MLRIAKDVLELAPMLIWMGMAMCRLSQVIQPTTPVW